MLKISVLIISLFFVSCSLFVKNLSSTNAKTMLGILIGLKPADGDFVLSEEPSIISEGSSQSVKFHLSKKPESDIPITIRSDSSAFSINGNQSITLYFTPTNYSTDKSFTITSLIDNNRENEIGNIIISSDYGYASKTWKVTNQDIQGANNWISLFPEDIYLPFLTSTVNVQVKLNIQPSENIPVNIICIFNKPPYGGSVYSNKGMTITSSLTFTPSNYQTPQTAIFINRDIIFNPDIINNSRTFRLLASSTTFSSKGDLTFKTNSVDENSMVTTIAGTGTAGFLDATGKSAQFNSPQGLATDGTNLYIADTKNHSIRKMLLSTSAVTTIAGNGTQGTADGTGANARFFRPHGVTVDAANQILYVADTDNHTIRRIDLKTNSVTTIAGTATQEGYVEGTGTNARFRYPVDMVLDGTNLYIADTYNFKIRKLDVNSNTTSLVAGSNYGFADGIGTNAQFTYPYGIDTDSVNLYIADALNYRIRKIRISDYNTTTLAGNGNSGSVDGIGSAARFNQPYRLANDATYIFVADTWNQNIRKIEIATGNVITIAGLAVTAGSQDGVGSAARFSQPFGIISDGSNVYVADETGNTIRRIWVPLF